MELKQNNSHHCTELNDYIGYNVNDYIQVHSVGCILCISDALNFAGKLNQMEKAIVFNTCAFIKDREIESRTLINILRKAYPDRKFYILGCDVDYQREYYENLENTVVLSNTEARQMLIGDPVAMRDPHDSNSMYIKVQDGCYHKCTYCIIHKLRGKAYSVPFDDILKDIKTQVEAYGYDRIVIGATEYTNYYDEKYGYNFVDMLERIIQEVPSIKQFAFSEFDPGHPQIKQMIKLVGRYPHLFNGHIILGIQSASNKILQAMGRRHTVESLKYLHEYAERYGVTLLWELIVGFPGETNELFMETYNNMKEMHGIIHNLFKYSPREGTPAALMPNQVSEDVKNERVALLQELSRKSSLKYKNNLEKYLKFTEEQEIRERHKEAIRQTLDFLDSGKKEINLDIYNEDEVVKFTQSYPKDVIVHIKYDMNEKLHVDIMIDFLTQFFKQLSIIVHVPKEFNEDLRLFSRHNMVLIKKDL